MKLLLIFALGLAASQAAEIKDANSCKSFPCLIFSDDFNNLDPAAWQHEVTLGGGGNWEFQAYVKDRSVTYTRDGTLFIKPELTANKRGEEFLTTGTWDLGAECTNDAWFGCKRVGANGLLNPVLSGRIRTQSFFNFRFGRVDVRAKMPRGDWLWPAIWLLPKTDHYGGWPASGEIDIVEARGNDNYGSIGNREAGSTMHWGPDPGHNKFILTHATYKTADGSSFADNFHTWRMDWTPDSITFYLDDKQVLRVDPGKSFWDFGGLGNSSRGNPWSGGSKMAPFDREFYLILNLAVGGVNGYFPDGLSGSSPKPWSNHQPDAPAAFWKAKNQWLPSWQNGKPGISESAALQVDYIKVWKLS